MHLEQIPAPLPVRHRTALAALNRLFALCSCLALLALLLALVPAPVRAEWPRMTVSSDGTPISYTVHGAGEPTLVFVHGWSCDARYWRMQADAFAGRHRVVLLDLAGHGHSGMGRTAYSMQSFGEDVRAVVEAAAGGEVILVGHSMGGAVIAEAARLLPGRVKGLIGVDTLENVEYPLTREELDQMAAPLKADFAAGVRGFVEPMLSPETDRALREWILADMAAAPPAVALSALEELMGQFITGEAARVFEAVRIPVVTVNGDLWPIDYAANRRHMASFEATVIAGGDHFLMMHRADEFNAALERAIAALTAPAAAQ